MKKFLVLLVLVATVIGCVACTGNETVMGKETKQWCIEKVQSLYEPQVESITAEKQFSDFDNGTAIKCYWVTVDNEAKFTVLIKYKAEKLNIAEEKVVSDDIVGFYVFDGHRNDLLVVG